MIQLTEAPPDGVDVTTMGTFACHVAGDPVPRWGAGRSRALLQYLVTRRTRSASRDDLVGGLWPDSDPANAANSLKVAAHALRRILRPVPTVRLEFTGDGYALRGDARCDVDELAELSRACRDAERSDDLAAASYISARATELHRGEFLPGEGAWWAEEVRAWIRVETLHLHDVACGVALRRVALEAVGSAARAALEVDPCHEPAYRAMMRLHARRGDRSAVDLWYRRCRRRLRADLDLHPDSRTTGLHSQAMRDGGDLPAAS